MKRLRLSLLMTILSLTILLLWVPTLSARAATYGDLVYTVADEQVTIIDCDTSAAGELIVPDTIDGYPITGIGSKAFQYCTNLTSIILPDSITTMEESAFLGCSKLSAITIPKGVTTIGDTAFSKCAALTSVTVPAGVTAIGEKAFYQCSNLNDVYIEDLSAWCAIEFTDMYANPLYLGENLYLENELVNDLVIPNGTAIIKPYAFLSCNCLTSVVIPDSVTYIGHNAFSQCAGLTRAVIGDGVTDMEHTVFAYCDQLTDITIGAGLTKIPEECFYYCTGLETIVIPEGIHTIDTRAFNSCTSLKEIAIPNTVSRIADRSFSDCSSLTEFTVPEGVTAVEDYTFNGCSGLMKITLPGSITSIGTHAFSACINLTEITIPEGVTSIPDHAFSICNKLTEVVIPEGVTGIGDYAFESCGALSKITVGSGVTSIGIKAFFSCNNLKTVCTTDLAAWCKIDYAHEYSTPLYYGAQLYLNDTLVQTLEIPTGITELKPYAFYNCQNLTSVTIPSGLTSIGDHAFGYCQKITKVTFGENLAVIGESAFYQCARLTAVTIPPSVTTIKSGAFNFCSKLNKVTISDLAAWCGIEFGNAAANPTVYANYLYLNNSLLTKLTIPDGVTQIKDYAFVNCEKITSVSIGAHVTDIASNAFRGCNALMKIEVDGSNPVYTSDSCGVLFNKDMTTLIAAPCSITGEYVVPDGTKTIEAEAFYKCCNLTAVTIANSVVNIGDGIFYGCENLVTAVLPEGITDITKQMFYNCKSLTALEIPEGVTYIRSYALQSCRALETLQLPQSLTSIGYFSLSGCESLTSIVLPAGVTSIDKNAFDLCQKLQTITFLGDAPTIGADAFDDITATVYYPADAQGWDLAVQQSYGGTITWIAVEPGPTLPTITLKYPTASFEDEIVLNIYFDAGDLEDVTEMGLITYSEAVDSPSLETAETVTSGYLYSETEKLYLVNSQGIAAKDMEKSLYMAVYARLTDDSFVYSPLVSYRPSDYAANVMVTGSPEMKAMMAATLSYGGAAQSYFGQEGSLSQVDTSLIASYQADMMDPVIQPHAAKTTAFEKTGGFTRGYPTVSFEGAFSINYYFTPAHDVTSDVQLYYWTAEDYAACETMTEDNATGVLTMDASDSEYHAVVGGIAAKDLDDTVYVTCVYSDGENRYCSGVLAYSIGAYCVSQAAGSGPLSELAAATAVYGYYAKQMFE